MKRIRKRIVAPAPAFSTALGLAIIAARGKRACAVAGAVVPSIGGGRSGGRGGKSNLRSAAGSRPQGDPGFARVDRRLFRHRGRRFRTPDLRGDHELSAPHQTGAERDPRRQGARRSEAGGAASARGCGLRRRRRPAERRSDRRAGAALDKARSESERRVALAERGRKSDPRHPQPSRAGWRSSSPLRPQPGDPDAGTAGNLQGGAT